MTEARKIEFFIERDGSRYVLRDRDGELHVDTRFGSVEAAADIAHRFAQENDLLPRFHFPAEGSLAAD